MTSTINSSLPVNPAWKDLNFEKLQSRITDLKVYRFFCACLFMLAFPLYFAYQYHTEIKSLEKTIEIKSLEKKIEIKSLEKTIENNYVKPGLVINRIREIVPQNKKFYSIYLNKSRDIGEIRKDIEKDLRRGYDIEFQENGVKAFSYNMHDSINLSDDKKKPISEKCSEGLHTNLKNKNLSENEITTILEFSHQGLYADVQKDLAMPLLDWAQKNIPLYQQGELPITKVKSHDNQQAQNYQMEEVSNSKGKKITFNRKDDGSLIVSSSVRYTLSVQDSTLLAPLIFRKLVEFEVSFSIDLTNKKYLKFDVEPTNVYPITGEVQAQNHIAF